MSIFNVPDCGKQKLEKHQERQQNLVRISIFQWLAAKVGLTQLDRMQGVKIATGSLV
jgi:hypothetical protein